MREKRAAEGESECCGDHSDTSRSLLVDTSGCALAASLLVSAAGSTSRELSVQPLCFLPDDDEHDDDKERESCSSICGDSDVA
jgi:hypothetical protein